MMRAMPRAMPFAQVHSTRMCLLELLGDDLCERLKAPKQGRREIPCWAMLGCVGGYVGHPYTLPTCRFFSGGVRWKVLLLEANCIVSCPDNPRGDLLSVVFFPWEVKCFS